MKVLAVTLSLIWIAGIQALPVPIRLVRNRGYQYLNPTTGRVLPAPYQTSPPGQTTHFRKPNPSPNYLPQVNFPPPITDEFGYTRNTRQLSSQLPEPSIGFSGSPLPTIFPDTFYTTKFSDEIKSFSGFKPIQKEAVFNPVQHNPIPIQKFQPEINEIQIHHEPSRPVRHFRKERKVQRFKVEDAKQKPEVFRRFPGKPRPAHKLRKKYPYYGRKRRSAEPYTLLDPVTGRNVSPLKNEVAPQQPVQAQRRPPKQNESFFRLPFLFNERPQNPEGNVRSQRKTPPAPTVQIQTPIVGSGIRSSNVDPYVSQRGIPLYLYRKKHPLGYGRKRRSAQNPGTPWTLLDPWTGRSVEPEVEQVKLHPEDPANPIQDPLLIHQHQQFQQSNGRFERFQPLESKVPAAPSAPEVPAYLDTNGNPVYKQHKRYPYSG